MTYTDDITIIVSGVDHPHGLGETIQEYKGMAGARVNQEKFWQLITRHVGRHTFLGHWMEELVKKPGVCFGSNLQIEKN